MMRKAFLLGSIAYLLSGLVAGAANTALPDTVHGFDDLPPGPVTTQLENRPGPGQGVVFGEPTDFGFTRTKNTQDGGPAVGQGEVSRFACGEPSVATSDKARSGGKVARMGCGTEFAAYGTFGLLPRWRTKLTAYVQVLTTAFQPGTFVLTGYDYQRKPIATDTLDTKPLAGWQALTINAGGPRIAFFALYWNRLEAGGSQVVLDDLTYDQPSVPPAPQISLNRFDGSRGVVVHQGETVGVDFTITRWNGSVGNVALTTDLLNEEIDAASFNPNPSAGSASRLSLHARINADPLIGTVESSSKVTASPLTAVAGTTSDSHVFPLSVLPVFAFRPIAAGNTVDLPPCTPTIIPAGLSVAAGFAQPISLTATVGRQSGAASAISARIEPATYTYGFSKPPEVTLLAPETEPLEDAVLSLSASSPGYPTRRASVKLRRIPTSVEAVVADLPGRTIPITELRTQEFLAPPQRIAIRGVGFCPSRPLVRFGNPGAITPAESVSSDGRRLTVSVPRLATSGPITVVTRLGEAQSAPIPVVSYRKRDGFKFPNYGSAQPYTFDSLVDAYGREQTYVTVDICPFIPFKSCPIPYRNLFVVSLADGIRDLGKGGLCFGMTLGSIRLRVGDDERTVWELRNADRAIRRTHLYQLSQEVNDLRDHGAESPASFGARLYKELRSDRPVIITFESANSGHAIVAYDLVDYGGGRFDIVAYDPNRPYDGSEDGDTIAASQAHQADEDGSVLRVLPNGTWVYPSFGWSGSMEKLTMLPYGAIPFTPTLSLNAPKISILMATGAGRVAQVTNEAGQTLVRANGRNNLAAFPGAAVLAPLDRRAGPNPRILLPSGGKFMLTVRGSRPGPYSAGFFNGRLTAFVKGTARTGEADEITLDGRAGALTFQTAKGAEPIAATLVAKSSDGSTRAVTLQTTSFASGQDSLAIDPTRGSVSIRHQGPPARVSLELGWTGTKALPAAFVSPRVRIGAGETLTLSPSWQSLGGQALTLTRTSAGGSKRTSTLRNVARTVRIGTPRLTAKTSARRAVLAIAARTTGSARRGAEATVTFLLLRGQRVVARYAQSVTPAALQRGVVWKTKRLQAGRYTFVGSAAVFAPARGGIAQSSAGASKRVSFTVG